MKVLVWLLALGIFPLFADDPDLKTIQDKAAQGDALAEFQLGRAYHLGHGVPQDFAKAADLYRKAAAQGNEKAMYNLGYIYLNGQGINQDVATAKQWFQKSAEKGLAAAQLEIALIYYDGPAGSQKDDALAFKWLTLAAKQDNPQAEFDLAYLYQHGKGVPQDVPQATQWYEKAAGHGLAEALLQIGFIYYFGDVGVKEDYVTAAKWLARAALPNNPPNVIGAAANALGAMNENGFGIPKNQTQAITWFTKAAEMGNARAQFNLGRLEYTGQSGKNDPAQAYVWLKLAADNKDAMAAHLLADYMMGKGFSPEQITEGDRKVRDFELKHRRPFTPPPSDQLIRE